MTKLLYFQFLPSVLIIFGILAIKFRWHFELSMSFCLYFSIYFSATLIERKMLKNQIKFTTRQKFKNSLSEMLRVQLYIITPYVHIMRVLIDYLLMESSLPFFQFLFVEDVYAHVTNQ